MRSARIELEENENRKDFTDKERRRTFAASKQMVADAKAAAAALPSAPEGKKPRGEKKKYAVPKADVAAALGVSVSTLVEAEHHEETAEEFPFMQGWRQSEGRARPLVRTARSNSTAGTSASCCHFEDWSRVMLRSARVAGPRGGSSKARGIKVVSLDFEFRSPPCA